MKIWTARLGKNYETRNLTVVVELFFHLFAPESIQKVSIFSKRYMGQRMRFWYLSHQPIGEQPRLR